MRTLKRTYNSKASSLSSTPSSLLQMATIKYLCLPRTSSSLLPLKNVQYYYGGKALRIPSQAREVQKHPFLLNIP